MLIIEKVTCEQYLLCKFLIKINNIIQVIFDLCANLSKTLQELLHFESVQGPEITTFYPISTILVSSISVKEEKLT